MVTLAIKLLSLFPLIACSTDKLPMSTDGGG